MKVNEFFAMFRSVFNYLLAILIALSVTESTGLFILPLDLLHLALVITIIGAVGYAPEIFKGTQQVEVS